MRPSAPPVFGRTPDAENSSPFSRLLRTAGLFLTAAALSGCPTPPTPTEKASEAAHELNMAARWGRMDIALRRSASEDQGEFMKRRASWHNGLRIVDTEMAGLSLQDATHATVQVDVSWILDDDTTLRVTRIEQKWHDTGGNWVMENEKRVGGALGLFGEKIERADKKKDTHFPTRTIR